MIHVCFALYDKTGRYSKFTGTTMLSLFEKTRSPVTVHILCDNTLSADNRDKLTWLAEQCRQPIKFYNVEELCADKITEIIKLVPAIETSRYSIATFYRFLIPNVLPPDMEKIIYLDSDVVVNLDIAQLWQIELGDKPFAAVVERDNGVPSPTWFDMCRDGLVRADDYFNAGVLLMNLNIFRAEEQALKDAIKFIAARPQCRYPDQDALNWCFSTRFLKLPRKFNRFTRWAKDEPLGENIYHYTVNYLELNTRDPFNRLWLDYFVRTPWYDMEIIGRIDEGVRQFYNDWRGKMIELSIMLSGKTRLFVVNKADVDVIKKIFAVRPDEEIFINDTRLPLQEVFATLNSARGKKICIVLVPNFPFANFEKLGFTLGKDFIDGSEFLPELWGLPFSTHKLVNMM